MTTVSQQISNEASTILEGNQTYNTYKDRWKFLLQSYMGGEDYRRGGHLTRYQLETDSEYQARLLSTPLENHCQSVVSTYTSFLFRRPPKRSMGTMEGTDYVEKMLADIDFEGRDIDTFMSEVAIWSSVFGHVWVMIAKPNVGANTLAEEIQQGVRPYLSMMTPLVVVDWEWARKNNGEYELNYMKYLEEVNDSIRTVKEWWPELIKTSVVDMDKGEITDTKYEVNELGIIPAVPVYNKRTSYKGFGTSDISDVADLQKFIYNATSEAEQTIRLESHPSLAKTSETEAGIGAGSIIQMPENLDPGLKPFLLKHDGASIDSIYQSIDHAVKTIEKISNIGSVRATETKMLSGVAMETEFQLLNARLSEKANNLELAEEQIWKVCAMYLNTTWNGEIKYPDSFNLRDKMNELQQLKIASEIAGEDPTMRQMINECLMNWLNKTRGSDYEYSEDEQEGGDRGLQEEE